MTVSVRHGDSRSVLREIADATFDSCVTDPPYALVSIVARFGKEGAAPAKGNDAYMRASSGFMGQQWDTGETAFDPAFWLEVLRVMKPGAHLVAFSGTRTYHRMACAIEDAGFEIRDQLQWLYGSGFPKSHDVSKGIDKAKGLANERGYIDATGGLHGGSGNTVGKFTGRQLSSDPVSAEAVQWNGWGTTLKPAAEPIVLARKPLAAKTVVANVLALGTGALNIDACRVAYVSDEDKASAQAAAIAHRADQDGEGVIDFAGRDPASLDGFMAKQDLGRWPANIVHDGSAEVLNGFPDCAAGFYTGHNRDGSADSGSYSGGWLKDTRDGGYPDSGSAARFFYTAKADSDDRLGSKHPTVKPIDLMQWLVRLVTRKGGLVLDPFAGSGTTGEAAWREGMDAVLIEREATFVVDINRRIAMFMASARERKTESVKAKMEQGRLKYDPGPLFGGSDNPDKGGREIYGQYADENGRRQERKEAPA